MYVYPIDSFSRHAREDMYTPHYFLMELHLNQKFIETSIAPSSHVRTILKVSIMCVYVDIFIPFISHSHWIFFSLLLIFFFCESHPPSLKPTKKTIHGYVYMRIQSVDMLVNFTYYVCRFINVITLQRFNFI